MTVVRSRLAALVALLAVAGCSSGRTYTQGIVWREKTNWFLFDFRRNEQRESWSIFCEPFVTAGATSAGNFYNDFFAGGLTMVNIPGWSLLLYPFQYHDQPDETAHVFGIGSGEGDLRISLLWGFISLGRNWNIFWARGFWMGKDDPLYSPPSDAAKSAYEKITVQPGS
jgi:hypothetical protein